MTLPDRKATPAELNAARRAIRKSAGGPGIAEGARRLGVTAGHLSNMLQGKTVQKLRLSDLRKLRQEPKGEAA